MEIILGDSLNTIDVVVLSILLILFIKLCLDFVCYCLFSCCKSKEIEIKRRDEGSDNFNSKLIEELKVIVNSHHRTVKKIGMIRKLLVLD